MHPALSTNRRAVSMSPELAEATAALSTSQISALPPYEGCVSQKASPISLQLADSGGGSIVNRGGKVQFG